MHRRLVSLVAVAAALVVGAIGAASAAAAPTWAPAASATIHPGVQLFTNGAQCTANFVFADASDVYIGQAARCSGTGAATDTDGCTSESRRLARRSTSRAPTTPARSSTTRG